MNPGTEFRPSDSRMPAPNDQTALPFEGQVLRRLTEGSKEWYPGHSFSKTLIECLLHAMCRKYPQHSWTLFIRSQHSCCFPSCHLRYLPVREHVESVRQGNLLRIGSFPFLEGLYTFWLKTITSPLNITWDFNKSQWEHVAAWNGIGRKGNGEMHKVVFLLYY